MPFYKEPTFLHKTSLSDLQGVWHHLREEVVQHHPFQDSQRLLFQIDEAMSWESVRDLEQMRKTFLVVHNIAAQAGAPPEVQEGTEIVRRGLEAVFEDLREGKIR
jgi:hypothetical protein